MRFSWAFKGLNIVSRITFSCDKDLSALQTLRISYDSVFVINIIVIIIIIVIEVQYKENANGKPS
jgi:hypothetical protein